MIIKFLGEKGHQKKTGCPVCGSKIKVSNTLSYTKRMILPSNLVKVFVLNHEYDVLDSDGEFLLNYHYSFGGKEVYPFVKVR